LRNLPLATSTEPPVAGRKQGAIFLALVALSETWQCAAILILAALLLAGQTLRREDWQTLNYGLPSVT
jgi:hypothetical protein